VYFAKIVLSKCDFTQSNPRNRLRIGILLILPNGELLSRPVKTIKIMSYLFYLVPVFGVLAMLYTVIKGNWVSKQSAGNARMQEISTYIAEGAMAFLKAEYKVLTYFVIIAALLLGVMGFANENSHWSIAIAFIIGAFFSALAGFLGMRIATKANVRTAEAARTSLAKALQVSFTGGAVMGLGVAGLAVIGLGGLFIVLINMFAPGVTADSSNLCYLLLKCLLALALEQRVLHCSPVLVEVFTLRLLT
jgi:Na+/H+-translocating membrane pyrophosphatase